MRWIILCIAIFFIFSCEQGRDSIGQVSDMELSSSNNAVTADTTVFQVDKIGEGEKTEQYDERKQQQQPALPLKVDWDKKIIKNATLKAEVADHKAFAKNLSEKVKSLGGYIATEQQSHNEDRMETTVTIKVPVQQFESSVDALINGASKVSEKDITSDDVTAEYVDGRSRLEAKKAVRLRYLELLKSAKNMADILAVQNEINSIQEEIEAVTGRINFLSQSSAMSTIQFTFYQVLNPSASNNDSSFGAQLKEALAGGWIWLGRVLIELCSIWPLWLFIVIGYFLFKRRILLKFK